LGTRIIDGGENTIAKEKAMSNRKSRNDGAQSPQPVAGNGLLDRRALLGRGVMLAGAMTAGVSSSLTSAAAEPLEVGPWSLGPGVPIPPYGQPSKFEQKVVRILSNPKLEPRGSAARTPHHLLNGTITPNGLRSLSARNDLSYQFGLTPAVPTSLVVKLVATIPMNGTCNNAAAALTLDGLAPGLAAWGTTVHNISGRPAITERPFAGATLGLGTRLPR